MLGSRKAALVAGPILHALADRIPHMDIKSRRFELRSGLAETAVLALSRGPSDPATLGALASALPDVEHVIRLPRPGGRKLFPTHRVAGWHRAGGVSIAAQLIVAGALLGAVVASGLARRRR